MAAYINHEMRDLGCDVVFEDDKESGAAAGSDRASPRSLSDHRLNVINLSFKELRVKHAELGNCLFEN